MLFFSVQLRNWNRTNGRLFAKQMMQGAWQTDEGLAAAMQIIIQGRRSTTYYLPSTQKLRLGGYTGSGRGQAEETEPTPGSISHTPSMLGRGSERKKDCRKRTLFLLVCPPESIVLRWGRGSAGDPCHIQLSSIRAKAFSVLYPTWWNSLLNNIQAL